MKILKNIEFTDDTKGANDNKGSNDKEGTKNTEGQVSTLMNYLNYVMIVHCS